MATSIPIIRDARMGCTNEILVVKDQSRTTCLHADRHFTDHLRDLPSCFVTQGHWTCLQCQRRKRKDDKHVETRRITTGLKHTLISFGSCFTTTTRRYSATSKELLHVKRKQSVNATRYKPHNISVSNNQQSFCN